MVTQLRPTGYVIFIFLLASCETIASVDTIGPNGTNSAVLDLTGDGVAIGQVESGRPGKPGMDNALFVHSSVVPVQVYVQTQSGAGITDMATTEHAVRVAGVMISTDAVATGVATEADLYSSAINPPAGPFSSDIVNIPAQHLATLPGVEVRAINMSFGLPLTPGTMPDGNSQIRCSSIGPPVNTTFFTLSAVQRWVNLLSPFRPTT